MTDLAPTITHTHTHTGPSPSVSRSRAPSQSRSASRAPSASASASITRNIPTTSTSHPAKRYSSALGGHTVTALSPGSVLPAALLAYKQQQQQQQAADNKPISLTTPTPAPTLTQSSQDTTNETETHHILTKMSVHELLSLHLDDYVVLIDGFLESLSDPHYITKGLPHHIITKILRKDQLMQQAVNRLVGHQRFERVLSSLRARVNELDTAIISFARTLGEHEQILHQQVQNNKQLTNLQGEVTKQRFPVSGVFHFSERLSTMSFAPPNFIEHIGMAANKPPAPLEKLMASSKLLMGVDELLVWAETERKRERGELTEASAMTDVSAPTTTAPVPTVPVVSSTTLPTFSELAPELSLAPLAPLTAPPPAPPSSTRTRRPVATLPIDLNSDLDFLDDAITSTANLSDHESDRESDDEL